MIAAILLAIGQATQPAPAPDLDAQHLPCGTFAEIVGEYIAPAGELRLGAGALIDRSMEAQVFINPATGSWTILSLDAAGTACIEAFGDTWTWDVGQ